MPPLFDERRVAMRQQRRLNPRFRAPHHPITIERNLQLLRFGARATPSNPSTSRCASPSDQKTVVTPISIRLRVKSYSEIELFCLVQLYEMRGVNRVSTKWRLSNVTVSERVVSERLTPKLGNAASYRAMDIEGST